mgnify:CR=1 FL=1
MDFHGQYRNLVSEPGRTIDMGAPAETTKAGDAAAAHALLPHDLAPHALVPHALAPHALDVDFGKVDVAVVGAGPAGLIAAERLAHAGYRVTIYDRMPSPARKLLMAGRGGLNLTHSEPLDRLLSRYRPENPQLHEALRAFPPEALVSWANELGIETYVGSSRRVFPTAMKASPLVRAWLTRLAGLGVRLEREHCLVAIERMANADGTPTPRLTFARKAGEPVTVTPRAVLLALGGASWPRLGSDGGWVALMQGHGVTITPLTPANCGLLVAWSAHVKDRFAGTPLKRIVLVAGDARFAGELMVTRAGLEGSPAYAAGPQVRAALAASGGAPVPILLDLRPDITQAELEKRLGRPRGKQSLATYLRKSAGLSPLAIALLRETDWETSPGATASLPGPPEQDRSTPAALASAIKALPLRITGLAGLDRAISTAGGIAWAAFDPDFMLHALPGVFAAGEMLDWEAPTGGYLLQGCFATGVAAASGIARHLQKAAARSEEQAAGGGAGGGLAQPPY